MTNLLEAFWDCMKGWLVVLSLVAGFVGGVLFAGGVGAWVINAGGSWLAIPAAIITFLVTLTLGSLPYTLYTS